MVLSICSGRALALLGPALGAQLDLCPVGCDEVAACCSVRDVPDDVYPLQRADAVQLPEWQGEDELEVLAAAEGHRRRGHTELLGHAGRLDVDG